jgi:hypothetical protein
VDFKILTFLNILDIFLNTAFPNQIDSWRNPFMGDKKICTGQKNKQMSILVLLINSLPSTQLLYFVKKTIKKLLISQFIII